MVRRAVYLRLWTCRPFRLYRYTGREERNLEALDLSDRQSNPQICLLNW